MTDWAKIIEEAIQLREKVLQLSDRIALPDDPRDNASERVMLALWNAGNDLRMAVKLAGPIVRKAIDSHGTEQTNG